MSLETKINALHALVAELKDSSEIIRYVITKIFGYKIKIYSYESN